MKISTIIILFLSFQLNAQVSFQEVDFEQKAFNYFFNSIYFKEYSNLDVVEFSCFTDPQLSSFRNYTNCLLKEDSLKIKLAQSSFQQTTSLKPIFCADVNKVYFKKIRMKSSKNPKLFIYTVNIIDDKAYILIELYFKFEKTDSYILEFDLQGNISRWCKTGIIH